MHFGFNEPSSEIKLIKIMNYVKYINYKRIIHYMNYMNYIRMLIHRDKYTNIIYYKIVNIYARIFIHTYISQKGCLFNHHERCKSDALFNTLFNVIRMNINNKRLLFVTEALCIKTYKPFLNIVFQDQLEKNKKHILTIL